MKKIKPELKPKSYTFAYVIIALITGIILASAVYEFNMRYTLRSPFQNPFVPRELSPIPSKSPVITAPKEKPVPNTSPKPRTQNKVENKRIAVVTAYSCGGLTTDAEIDMNCPSLRNYPQGRTATGTTPIPNKTVACDKANLGRTFHLEGVGEVTCEDVGGGIKGAGRFDLYLETVQEARNWGVRKIAYKVL